MDEARTYRKNFITKVLFRIDFARIPALVTEPTAFKDLIATLYPTLEPVVRTGIVFGAQDGTPPTAQQTTETLWQFTNVEGNQHCNILPESLVIEASTYQDFSTFRESLSTVITAFLNTYTGVSIERIGLRYINEISISDDTDYLEWENYINPLVSSIVKFIPEGSRLKRSLNTAEYEIDADTSINVRTGVFNSRYPAEIIQKEFVIDLDCFSRTRPANLLELMENIAKYNAILTDTFEVMVEEPLREIMDAE